MAIHAMYKDRWTELFVCAIVVAFISLEINLQNPAGIVIITSLASTSLALMVAPGAPTNSIRSVFLSYTCAMFVSVAFGMLFSSYIDRLFDNDGLLFFIKFFTMLVATLFLFGLFNAYHPPSIGAMLTYFIDTGFSDWSLMIYVPISVVFLLACLKSYIYFKHPEQFKWKNLKNEFTRDYRMVRVADVAAGEEKKTIQIAKRLNKENIDEATIVKITKLSEEELDKIL
ncbi:MAG: hypothetical protein ACI9N9_000887 [Enterobacterales bacterium]|jgi:hypothetical protein